MFADRICRVDLRSGRVSSERIPREILDQFVGGKGLGAAYLYRELGVGTDPLSPENRLVLTWGPLSGLAPGCSRYCAITKSPQTNAFLHSYAGGHFPSALRAALPDHLGIMVEGRAEKLVSLKVEDGRVEIVDARDLKGKTIDEVCDRFPGYRTACIGPAGENLVKYATIGNDFGTHHAGRGGAGAVMGSKNLKAVIAKARRLEPPPGISELVQRETRRLATSDGTKGYRESGTARIVAMTNETGTLPTMNWTKGSFKHAGAIGLDMVKANAKGKVACTGCPIACGFNLKMRTGAFEGLETGKGPEYETLGMVGANCGISDLSVVAKIGDVCNKLGMDTISVGNVLGWAMECADRGLIDHPIRFGDGPEAVALTEKIAYRDGIGALLAEGTWRAASEVGVAEASEAAVHVKGLEPPAYDPRGSYSMALAYATSDRGACHMRAWGIGGDVFGDRNPFAAEMGHAEGVIAQQDSTSVVPDSLLSCAFARYTVDDAVEWLSALGYAHTRESLVKAGERIWNLTRLFNTREGFSRKDDALVARMTCLPITEAGPAEGMVVRAQDLEAMLDWYYEKRGWDHNGIPLPEKLAELNLART